MQTLDIQVTHLHQHTEFSLLDGNGKPKRIVDRVLELGQTAIAITDHGNVWGHYPFYKECMKRGVKPILGIEAYVVPDDASNKTAKIAMSTEDIPHITILCKNIKGYHNLIKLVEYSNEIGFYKYPRIDLPKLVECQEGLIVLSGCPTGIPSRMLFNSYKSNVADIYGLISNLKNRIEHFYIEAVPWPGFFPSEMNFSLFMGMSEALNIPLVITGDNHFPSPEDWEAQKLQQRIGMNTPFKDELPFPMAQFGYIGTAQNLYNRAIQCKEGFFRRFNEAIDTGRILFDGHRGIFGTVGIDNPIERYDGLMQRADRIYRSPFFDGKFISGIENTNLIADMVDLEMPKAEPLHYVGAWKRETQSSGDALRELAARGLEYRISQGLVSGDTETRRIYTERYMREIRVLEEKNFCDYILFIADIVNVEKAEGHLCICRGSAGGCLLIYLLNVSITDPIRWGLSFERFYNETRSNRPDIDMDFSPQVRDNLIKKLIAKHGADKVARVSAFSFLKAKGAVSNIMRLNNLPTETADSFMRDILDPDDDQALTPDEEAEAFAQHIISFPDLQQVKGFATIPKILGQAKTHTINAAGVALSSARLSDVVPVIRRPDKDAVITLDKHSVEELNIWKFDFLSLITLARIENVMRQTGLTESDLLKIDLDDPNIYNMIGMGAYAGIFQADGSVQKIAQKKPISCFKELCDYSALCRPGASDYASAYVKHSNDPSGFAAFIQQVHPIFRDVVAPTFTILLYQETVMKMLEAVGFEWVDIHAVRGVISKSKVAEIQKYRAMFIEKAIAKGVSQAEAEYWWHCIELHGKYSFNASHAFTYAIVGAIEMHLKCYYPKQFYTAALNVLLSQESVDGLLIHRLVREAVKFGVFAGTVNLECDNADSVSVRNYNGKDYLVGGWGGIKGVRSRGESYATAFKSGKPTLTARKLNNDLTYYQEARSNAGTLSTSIWCPAYPPDQSKEYRNIIATMGLNDYGYMHERPADVHPSKHLYSPNTLPTDVTRLSGIRVAGYISYETSRQKTLAMRDEARVLYLDDGISGVEITASNKYAAYAAIRGKDKDTKIKPGDFVVMKCFWNGLKLYVHEITSVLRAEEILERYTER